MRMAVVLFVASFTIGCTTIIEDLPDRRIDNISQILMHNSSYFTFMIRDSSGIERPERVYNIKNFVLVRDVNDGLSWVLLKQKQEMHGGALRKFVELMELHMSKNSKLVGGQWSTGGKITKQYQTVVIE